MIAAIYARKSTEQAGVADEQKSVSAGLGMKISSRKWARLEQ